MKSFLAAIERQERESLATGFALLVTAQRGDPGEIKRLLKELARETQPRR